MTLCTDIYFDSARKKLNVYELMWVAAIYHKWIHIAKFISHYDLLFTYSFATKTSLGSV